ncbi:MAG: STAS domain-containing protein [Spirochaetaceae bacterium]|jgi:SulP family sulfate permease|nr:STAS domain-containing protein [Spirochaetaceae bacterium]
MFQSIKKVLAAYFKEMSFEPRIAELLPRNGGYTMPLFGKDVLAGVIVGVVALPLSMAFSISAGGTPAQGIYTAIMAGFFVSLLGGSKFQIAGPTGAFVTIIFGVQTRYGMDGLIMATILAGLMLLAMGLSGLGKFIKYIPHPVTMGFTTGIGLLIFSQQIKDLFALDIAASSPEFFTKWAEYAGAFSTFQWPSLALGLATIAVIILMRRFAPRIPGAAAAVAIATIVTAVFSLPVETIGSRYAGIPASLPIPALPALNWEIIRDVLPSAFTIALLAAIESLLSAVVADGMTGDRHNANMELVAQGLGNLAAGLFGGIPATGAIARTATNIKNGAVSPVSGLVHVLTLVVFILFLAPAASSIPLASLAGVLIVVSWDMSDIPRFVRLMRASPKSDTIVLLTTFALTVTFDLTFAVEIGVILAVFLFLRRVIEVAAIKPENNELIAELAYGEIGKRTRNEIEALSKDAVEIYEISGPFFFGVTDMLQTTLRTIPQNTRVIILRMRDVPAVDASGIAALETFMAQCKAKKITLMLSEIREQPLKALGKYGFIDSLGVENVKDTLPKTLDAAEDIVEGEGLLNRATPPKPHVLTR